MRIVGSWAPWDKNVNQNRISRIVVYLGGLAAAELIGKDSRLQEIPRVQDYFGDLLKSMYPWPS